MKTTLLGYYKTCTCIIKNISIICKSNDTCSIMISTEVHNIKGYCYITLHIPIAPLMTLDCVSISTLCFNTYYSRAIPSILSFYFLLLSFLIT